MPSRKVTEVEITRHIALEGTRRENWVVDKKQLHKFEEFTEWFAENKSSLPERILRSDSNILQRFIEDRIANTGEREWVVWNQVITEICGDSETDDDDMEEVYGAESEYSTRDASHWQHYAEQPASSLVTESDTEPEPEPVAVVPEVVVVEPAEPISEAGNNAHFIALCNRQKQFEPDDITIRVDADTMGKLLDYANARWHTAYPGEGEALGREWDIVQSVLTSRELWIHMCHLIDRWCYNMGLLSTGEG